MIYKETGALPGIRQPIRVEENILIFVPGRAVPPVGWGTAATRRLRKP